MSRDIVFICLDSVRQDFFSQAGSRTQRLADISFDNCRAASSWSVPSHASMITGLLAHEHGITTHSRSFDSLPKEETFFEDLEEYRTVGISGNVYASHYYQFSKYFDSFFYLEPEQRFPEALSPSDGKYDMSIQSAVRYVVDAIDSGHPVRSLSNGVTSVLSRAESLFSWTFDEGATPGLRLAQEELERSDDPLFIFLNLMDGHNPYHPARYLNSNLYDVPLRWSSGVKGVWELIKEGYDERYWERRNQLYRATIEYLDRCISDFVGRITDDTTVIVTADHGDNLGTETDEGLANHKSSLSEGLLHVPFHVINAPEIAEQTGRYLSHLAIPDLIKGCQAGRVPDLRSDRAFAELGGMSAGPDPDDDYAYYDRAIRCAYNENRKVIWDSLGECVNYELDAGKTNYQRRISDCEHPPAWATDRFEGDITAFKNQIIDEADEVSVDESAAERLEDLGYL